MHDAKEATPFRKIHLLENYGLGESRQGAIAVTGVQSSSGFPTLGHVNSRACRGFICFNPNNRFRDRH
jgi:hypothetical protein